MIEPAVFTNLARDYMRPWLFPIAKALYELALDQDDEIGSAIIARLADQRDCCALSTEEQLHQMKTDLQRSEHAETYLHYFRQYFKEQEVVLEGF